jgi:hypothetical protein
MEVSQFRPECIEDDRLLALRAMSARRRRAGGIRIVPITLAVLNLFVCGWREDAFRTGHGSSDLSWLVLAETIAMLALMLAASVREFHPLLDRAEHAGLPGSRKFAFLFIEFVTDFRLIALGASFGFAAMVSVHFQMPATSAILAAAACWWGVMIASGSALILLARSSGTSLESIAIAGGISLFLLLTLPPVALAERVIQALPVSGWTAWTMTAAAAGNTGDAALWLIPSLAFGAACALCARTRG